MSSIHLDNDYDLFFKCKAANFTEFTEDINNFTLNYLDFIQKHKVFELNRRIYKNMIKCFDNLRQTNENIENCIAKHKDPFNKFDKFYQNNYIENSKYLDKCTDDCKGVEDISCLNDCGTNFKNLFHKEINQIFTNLL